MQKSYKQPQEDLEPATARFVQLLHKSEARCHPCCAKAQTKYMCAGQSGGLRGDKRICSTLGTRHAMWRPLNIPGRVSSVLNIVGTL